MEKRIAWIGMGISLIILVLMGRLWSIQISNGRELSLEAVQQRVLQVELDQERGNFLDRNLVPLTGSSHQTHMILFPMLLTETSKQELAPFMKEIPNAFDIEKARTVPYMIIPIERLSVEIRKKIKNGELPGVALVDIPIRYSENSLARHLIGYMNAAVGKGGQGLEKDWNDQLKSNHKKMIYGMIDAKRNIVPGIAYKVVDAPGVKPLDVVLTLDYHIQKIVEEEMDKAGKNGSVIIASVDSGDILALASRPNFSQTDFESSKQIEGAFINKAASNYAPGSVFKTVVLAAALENNIIEEKEVFYCTGGIWLGQQFIGCHQSTGGLGALSLEQAFAHSCNDTFVRIAQRLGGEKIIATARKFGFGESPGIGIPGEHAGTLPEKSVFAGNGIGNLALGQGEVRISPIQVTDMMLTILNGGTRKKLRIIEGLLEDKNDWKEKYTSQELGQVLNPKTADLIKYYMDRVPEYGTAISANSALFGWSGGKTGTPQKSSKGQEGYNGWFVGYFPREKPKYVITVFLEDVNSGGQDCAPVFREIAIEIRDYEDHFIKLEP